MRFLGVGCRCFNQLFRLERHHGSSRKVELLGYNCDITEKKIHTTKLICESKTESDGGPFPKYDDEEKNTILNILNASDPLELSRFSISKGRLKNLLDKRNKNGHFESFIEIANVKGFTVPAFEKMCDSILVSKDKKEEEEQKTVKIKGKFLEPHLDLLQKNEIKSACSLIVDLNHTSWSLIESNGNYVTSLDFYRYEDVEVKKLKLSNIMEIVWKICQQIPRSDVYIMEALPTAQRSGGADSSNPKSIHINLQRVQLICMVAAALNALENFMVVDVNRSNSGFTESFILPEFKHKVFYLKPLLASRLFKTYVGNERVSPQSIVEAMMSGNRDSLNENSLTDLIFQKTLQRITPVNFSVDVRERYRRCRPSDKEILSQTLILANTFMELFIYENANLMMNLNNKQNV